MNRSKVKKFASALEDVSWFLIKANNPEAAKFYQKKAEELRVANNISKITKIKKEVKSTFSRGMGSIKDIYILNAGGSSVDGEATRRYYESLSKASLMSSWFYCYRF